MKNEGLVAEMGLIVEIEVRMLKEGFTQDLKRAPIIFSEKKKKILTSTKVILPEKTHFLFTRLSLDIRQKFRDTL